MRRIKILRIIARLNIGGPAQNAILLTEGLNDENFETLLVAGLPERYEGDMSYLAKEKNINLQIVPQLRREINPIIDAVAFWKIFRIILLEKPTIIHTHTAKAGTLGRIAGLLYNIFSRKKCKLVHTFHGHVLEGYFKYTKKELFLCIERLLARFTDTIVTVSESVRSELLEFKIGSAGKIAVIPLGLELDRFLNLDRGGKQSRRNGFNIGIVGRLVPIKNHKMFLQIAKRLHSDSIEKVKFIIVGDGELRAELEGYAERLGIKDIIEFTGWRRDIENIYSLLDIVCLTSLNEGTPVSLIEAMAAGKSVVASDVGGVKDIMGRFYKTKNVGSERFMIMDNGILVASQDAEGTARAIKLLLQDNDLRDTLSQKAREFARGRFDKGRLVADIKRLYTQMCGEII